MANISTHNQPSREAQVKGGQHSHQGSQSESAGNESSSGKAGNRTPPSREEASKGGQHSHSGGSNR